MSTQKSSTMTFRELFRTIRKTILNTNSGWSSRGAKLKLRENLFETRFGFPEVTPEVEGAESGAESNNHTTVILGLLKDSSLSTHQISEKLKLGSVTGAVKRAIRDLLEKKEIG